MAFYGGTQILEPVAVVVNLFLVVSGSCSIVGAITFFNRGRFVLKWRGGQEISRKRELKRWYDFHSKVESSYFLKKNASLLL